MTRVGILGGGISGLSAAFYLEKQRRDGADLSYTLLENSNRLGGVMITERVDDCLLEAGPDSFLTEKPWAANLCRDLGIADQLIGSNDSERKTYILVKGRLIPIPDGLMFMVPTRILPTAFSPLFSWSTKLRMAWEFFHKPNHHSGAHPDESVATMVRRHFGQEVVDRLADPLLAGVYGGDASTLSVRAVLPRFADMEQKYGSLSRAMLAARRQQAASRPGAAAAAARPLFSSLKDGMQQLVDALLPQLAPGTTRPGTGVSGLALEGATWRVRTRAGESLSFDRLIVAIPAAAAAPLFADVSQPLADDLAGIPYTSSVTVTLTYDRAALAGLPPGFGYLVPRTEGKRMLAATFVHNKFPHRAPMDKGIVRCFLGGSGDEDVLGLTDDDILRIVREELRQIVHLTAKPRSARVYRWRGSMAQYGPGHLDRVVRIRKLQQQLPGLALAGNAYDGIGVPDCVRSGMAAAEAVGAPRNLPQPAAQQVR